MRRNNKSIYIVFIMVVLISVTIGYAVINTTLNINGKSSISKNTWDVYFDNIVVKEDSVEAEKIPTITDKTTVDFEVALNLPGDFYEFTVDVVNEGSIDAMIESIEKTPDLTEMQQKYLNYIIEYQNGEQIATKQLVKSEEFVRLKVRVEYKSDLTASDLPTTTEILNLGFTVNYVQSDSNGVSVTDNGILKVKPIANGDINEIGTIVTIGDQQFYTIGTEGDNVKLLSMYNLYVGNECTSNSSSSCTPYGDETTGKQDSTMLGYVSGQTIRKGTTAFSSSTQKGINYSDYNGSIVEGYVNVYKGILEGEEYGIDVVEARLIIKEELEGLGCSRSSCSSAPSWVYATSYWSGSVKSPIDVWYVFSDGDVDYDLNDYVYFFGVRPVIVMLKDDIEKEIIEFTIEDITYQAEVGMNWEEWVDSEYNTLGFYVNDLDDICLKIDNELYVLSYDETAESVLKSNDLIDNSWSYRLLYGGFDINLFFINS